MYLKKFVLSYQSQGTGDGILALALAHLVGLGGEVIKPCRTVTRAVCDIAAHFLANARIAAGGDRLISRQAHASVPKV